MLLQRGVSVYDLTGVLGTSEDVMRRTYGHYADDHLKRAVAAVSRRYLKPVNKCVQKAKNGANVHWFH
jgi:hypothetical protein